MVILLGKNCKKNFSNLVMERADDGAFNFQTTDLADSCCMTILPLFLLLSIVVVINEAAPLPIKAFPIRHRLLPVLNTSIVAEVADEVWSHAQVRSTDIALRHHPPTNLQLRSPAANESSSCLRRSHPHRALKPLRLLSQQRLLQVGNALNDSNSRQRTKSADRHKVRRPPPSPYRPVHLLSSTSTKPYGKTKLGSPNLWLATTKTKSDEQHIRSLRSIYRGTSSKAQSRHKRTVRFSSDIQIHIFTQFNEDYQTEQFPQNRSCCPLVREPLSFTDSVLL